MIKLSLSVPVVCNLLEKMVNPLSAKEMRAFCNLKDSSYFKTNVIDPLIEAGLIAMTHPDSPKSPKQKYYLSEYGRSLLENQHTSDAGSKVSRLLAELTDEERRMALEILKGDEK